jgi:hypothetical protein
LHDHKLESLPKETPVKAAVKPAKSPHATGRKKLKQPSLAHDMTEPSSVTVKTHSGEMPVPIDTGNDIIINIKRKLGKKLCVPPTDFKLYPVRKEDAEPFKNRDKPRKVMSFLWYRQSLLALRTQ